MKFMRKLFSISSSRFNQKDEKSNQYSIQMLARNERVLVYFDYKTESHRVDASRNTCTWIVPLYVRHVYIDILQIDFNLTHYAEDSRFFYFRAKWSAIDVKKYVMVFFVSFVELEEQRYRHLRYGCLLRYSITPIVLISHRAKHCIEEHE